MASPQLALITFPYSSHSSPPTAPPPFCLVMLIRNVTCQEFYGSMIQEFVTCCICALQVILLKRQSCAGLTWNLCVILELILIRVTSLLNLFCFFIWLCCSHTSESYFGKFPPPSHHRTHASFIPGGIPSLQMCTFNVFGQWEETRITWRKPTQERFRTCKLHIELLRAEPRTFLLFYRFLRSLRLVMAIIVQVNYSCVSMHTI